MEAVLFVLVVAALLGLIPATIAANKGRTFFLWWLYGAGLFIIALPHSLLTGRNTRALEEKQLSNGMRKCPSCAELVKEEAIVCRFCQRDLPPVEKAPQTTAEQEAETIQIMDQHGITFDGFKYYRDGKPYSSLEAAVEP